MPLALCRRSPSSARRPALALSAPAASRLISKHHIASVQSVSSGATADLASAFAESDGKPLRYPKLDTSGCGRLKDVTRKAFEAALRSREDNLFKRAYEQALASTHNKTHARLSVQRGDASRCCGRCG